MLYLFVVVWAFGVVFTIGGFAVQPRSQAPLFFIFGIICLGVAIYWTWAKITAPKREAAAQKKEKLEEQTKREQEEKLLAHMEGLAKYQKMDTDDAIKYQEGIAAMRQLGNIVQQSIYQEKEKDWAILGGIAQGIAGPAAGVATAAKAIQDNARISAENAARRELGAKQSALYYDLADQAAHKSPTVLSLSELQERFEVILSWAPSTLYAELDLFDTKTEVDTQTGAVTVSTTWYHYDKSICIDGALRAKIYTDSGECAGCAYLVLPKEGTAGLKGNLSGICAHPKPATSYTVTIEPVDLWELASKSKSSQRKTDNLTDEEHRKIVAISEAKFQEEIG